MKYVIELFENTGITYWLDGGWGVDILAGKKKKKKRLKRKKCELQKLKTEKQTRIHRDIDINFDAQHTEKLLNVLLESGL